MKLVREFEEGDVIAHMTYNWVAVRLSTEAEPKGKWYHTNMRPDSLLQPFDDKYVDDCLYHGTWKYMGNAVKEGNW